MSKHHKHVRLAIFYRDFTKVSSSFSHVGLGVNAHHTKTVLLREGVDVHVFGVPNYLDIYHTLTKDPTITHALIEAPVWVWENTLATLSNQYPNVKFIVRLHSQIAFLTVEPSAFKNVRDILELQRTRDNVFLSANSLDVVDWIVQGYKANALYLPNLYDLEWSTKHIRSRNRDHLKIASYGSLRLLKNHCTSAAAAMVIARNLDASLDFHVNVNREEQGKGVLDCLVEMFRDVPRMKLVQDPWAPWRDFRKTIASMDLTMQVSHTETFNIVTADSVAEGVPAVVSPSVDWAPESWKAPTDQVERIAHVGARLIEEGPRKGREALENFIARAIYTWLEFLN